MLIWTDSALCHQPSSSYEEQVAKGEQGEQLRPIFGPPVIEGIYVVQLTLDEPKQVLDFRAHHDDHSIHLLVDRIQLTTLWGLAHQTQRPSDSLARDAKAKTPGKRLSERSMSTGRR
jgi:hypothetical protein